MVLLPSLFPIMLSFLRRTLGRRSIRKHAEKTRLREAQRATTHIPAAGDAKSIITCRVSLLDGTDVSVDLPVRTVSGGCVCGLTSFFSRLHILLCVIFREAISRKVTLVKLKVVNAKSVNICCLTSSDTSVVLTEGTFLCSVAL